MPQNQAGSVYVPRLARTGEPGLKTPSQYDDENRLRQAADQEQQLRAMTVSMAVEAQREKNKAQRQQQEEQAFLQDAMSRYVHDNGRPDLDTVASEYERVYPQSGMKFREEINKGRKSSIDITNAELEMKSKVASTSARMLKMATPQNYPDIRASIVQLDPQADGKLPPQFDPVVLKSIIDQADAYTGAQSEQIKANELLKNGNVQESVSRRVGVIQSQKDLDDFYDDMSAMMDATAFKALKNTYGATYTGPDWNIRADQANLTADQRRQQANTVADDKRQDAQQATSNAIAQGNLDVASGNLAIRKQEANKPTGEGSTGGAKLSATAIDKVAAVDQARGMIDDLDRLFPNMSGAIGPLDQYMTKGKLSTGRGLTKDLTDFDTQLTALKNAVIKATTGAAMSEPEAQRIMGQIPDWGNPEQVFKSRLEMTRKNLELLKKRTIELAGGTVEAPTTAAKSDPLGIRKGG